MTPVGAIAIGLIRVYQWVISPLLPRSCRFAPSCSEYAAEAIGRHGVLAGCWLALRRLARCHPWGGDGYDPVPEHPWGRRRTGVPHAHCNHPATRRQPHPSH